MKKFLSILFISSAFVACTAQVSDVSEGEQKMADMMGITVEELRSQTPEEHMQMMQDLHNAQ